MAVRTRVDYARKEGATRGEIAARPRVVTQAVRATAAFNAQIAPQAIDLLQ